MVDAVLSHGTPSGATVGWSPNSVMVLPQFVRHAAATENMTRITLVSKA